MFLSLFFNQSDCFKSRLEETKLLQTEDKVNININIKTQKVERAEVTGFPSLPLYQILVSRKNQSRPAPLAIHNKRKQLSESNETGLSFLKGNLSKLHNIKEMKTET